LEQDEMTAALCATRLAVVRSGCGTIAELALFGIPAIYIPLPTSFADHQLHNALEIERLGGGSVLRQSDATSESLLDEWQQWFCDAKRREVAAKKLRNWSIPDATERVFKVLRDVAG
jgi:UDP-N-acetylglucosamine--N-acetylmuramyl-(pentapeptide) pyrophosphoryl-undecaprenol N-acetylglucosamine transferase